MSLFPPVPMRTKLASLRPTRDAETPELFSFQLPLPFELLHSLLVYICSGL